MAFRRWLAEHRPLVLTATSGTVIAALIATVAVVSNGYSAQKLELQDSSVWVSNAGEQAIGRINTEVLELNSVMRGAGSDLDLLQDGSTILVVDHADSSLDIVDAATSTISDTVPLPPNDPQVLLAGGAVAILARGTGELWTSTLANLASFDAESAPTLTLGADAVASIDDDGLLVAYSPSAKQVYEIEPARSDEVQSSEALDVQSTGALTISSVDGSWALLDSAGPTLYLPGRIVDLTTVAGFSDGADGTGGADGGVEAVDPGASTGDADADTDAGVGDVVRLQQPSTRGDSVLVASQTGLASVPINDGDITVLVTGQVGAATAPLVLGDCTFAAWAGSNAWRSCAGDAGSAGADADAETGTAGSLMPLEGSTTADVAVFRHNGDRVVLNDGRSGASWAVAANAELINNWADLIPVDDDTQSVETTGESPPQLDPVAQPPVAVDDEFGARPGRTSVLPVLLNDYDPNGDVLGIDSVSEVDATLGRVDIIGDRQQLQVTLPDTASGSISFRYTISDGLGGTASASVTVTVRGPDENSAPLQVRPSNLVVESGGRATANVLGDWVDPDGDAFYLADATVRAPSSVSFTPGGVLVFTEGGDGGAAATVELTVDDGTASGLGSLTVTVEPAGTVPIVADPFIVLAVAGTDVTVSPLVHVHGGSGTLRLNSVPAKAGVSITPSYDAGTFRFNSTAVGTHYLDYVVTDGEQTATGTVRVDVSAPAQSARPITIPKTVFVQTLRTESVDVAGTDIDPAGGVLVVTGLSNLDQASGVSAEVIDQRVVQVRLDAPLEGPVDFNYRISNGLADAEGTITVVEIPVPASLQPPVANNDEVTVRVGAAINIPVLDNDEQPDGADLTLLPTLAQDLPEDAGLLFSSGNVLRYLAPEQPGNFLAVYEIEGPDGQRARAQLRISVREADADTNSAPVPSTLTARVLAGASVTIPIPLSGIDPDGDTVQLLGQETSPEKGAVTSVGSDTITYRAGDYSAGTDEFQYAVVDALGARATGVIRVGISARLDGARNPVATIDDVTARPGSTVSVRVLANDSDPDGSPLRVVSAVPNDEETTAEVVGDLVVVTPPNRAGVFGVVYTIENEEGGSSSNFIRVTVDPDAPASYPVVTDTVLTLGDIIDRDTVDVDVLANVFFADGDTSTLELDVPTGFASVAEVTAANRIRVTVRERSQIIPFRVTHPDDATVFSYGFVWVPGSNDALPQLNQQAAPLVVTSQDSLVIELNDYVLAVGGKPVILTDSSTVRSTHSNGAELVVDADTLVFTSADRYFGEASISFQVTDGTSADDPAGRTATLVLPITVLPRENQPPVFDGAVLEVEPAEERTIDLSRLTTYPYPDDVDELAFTVLSIPENFTYALSGQNLTLRANESAAAGAVTSMSIGVQDGVAEGQSGRIQLAVVPSTRPLLQPATDTATVRRGASTVIDVLQNDSATNPFPADPLRVVAIRGIDSAALPEGIRVSPSEDLSSVSVTVAATAAPSDTSFQYQVADVTGDPNRLVWGTVRISVQDRPDPVTDVRVTEFGDRSLTVAWAGGAFNNSPITGYQVILSDADSGEVVSSTDCGGGQCVVPTDGNGSDNAVRIAVVAINSIGVSDVAQAPGSAWSDVVPSAPSGIGSTPVDHGVRVVWTKPASSGGSAITKYVVTVAGMAPVEVAVPADDLIGTEYSRTIVDPGISNGSSVSFTVSARNQAADALARWNSSSGTGTAAGPPTRVATPTASVSVDTAGSATLSWPGAFNANGRAITNYYAAVFTDEAPSCTVSGDVLPGTAVVPEQGSSFRYAGTSTTAQFSGLTPNTTYRFVVYAFNGMGCTSSVVVEATPRSRPGTVTGATIVGPDANGDTTWDFSLNALAIASGSGDADSFIYRLSGGTVEGGSHGPRPLGSILDASNNSQYGQVISVEIKACRSYAEFTEPLCSANWSSPQRVGVPVSNTELGALAAELDQPDSTPTPTPTANPSDPNEPAEGTYSWSSSPSGQYSSVSYSCGAGSTQLNDGEGGSCAVVEDDNAEDGSSGFAPLVITIRVGGVDYVREYNWNDYD